MAAPGYWRRQPPGSASSLAGPGTRSVAGAGPPGGVYQTLTIALRFVYERKRLV